MIYTYICTLKSCKLYLGEVKSGTAPYVKENVQGPCRKQYVNLAIHTIPQNYV